MKTTKRIALSVASAVLLSLPALAAARAPAPVDHAALYGDPTWPQFAPRAPGVTLPGPGARESFLHGDPTWPSTGTLAPALALDTYVARGSFSSIANDSPSLAAWPFAALDGEAPSDAVARR